MTNISILDCTLRDGAYIVDGNFGKNTIRGVIRNLVESNIDIIEVGWLKDTPHDENSTYYEYVEDIMPYLPEHKNKSLITVMFDYGRYDINKLSVNKNNSVDAIRLVFPKEKHIEAIRFSDKIKQLGYKLYLQAANTLGYSENELISLAEETNKIKPTALSIVDTFGVMYEDDLKRIYSILDKYLDKDIQIGFHSHNNLQMSFALSISFINLIKNSSRGVIIDSSLVGMGRGAGNTCTELLVNYTNKKLNTNYNYNCIMDTIDRYIKPFIDKYKWGYSIPFCIAGQLGSHVNNISYLQNIHKTNFMDLKLILEAIPRNERRLYDYDRLEKEYINYQNQKIDDTSFIEKLNSIFKNKKILLIAPGKTISTEANKINEFILKFNPILIGINSILPNINYDFVFFSNKYKYDFAKEQNEGQTQDIQYILLSNIKTIAEKNEYIINYSRLVRSGWKYFDNSTIILVRLLSQFAPKEIHIAGFDGYNLDEEIVYDENMINTNLSKNEKIELNENIKKMLIDYIQKDKFKTKLNFITKSLFAETINFKN